MGSRASNSPILYLSIFLTLNSSSIGFVYSSSCSSQSIPILFDLRLQCPTTISSFRPIQMDGESLERCLDSKPIGLYTVVLFHGSWCPFSSGIRPKFELLSSIFPQVEHIEVEHSSATPSLFSRYGVHSLPALLIFNQTTNERYYGRKDLHSLARFYQKTTGFDATKELSRYNLSRWLNGQNPNRIQVWYKESSVKEIIVKESCLMLAISFLILRVVLFFCPPNLGVFVESRQLLSRVMHIINVKGLWENLEWSKTRNFHQRF